MSEESIENINKLDCNFATTFLSSFITRHKF